MRKLSNGVASDDESEAEVEDPDDEDEEDGFDVMRGGENGVLSVGDWGTSRRRRRSKGMVVVAQALRTQPERFSVAPLERRQHLRACSPSPAVGYP